MILFQYVIIIMVIQSSMSSEDLWGKVPCYVEYTPENCDFQKIPLLTVEDFERCSPALLSLRARNYFLGAAGRRLTYAENKEAYKRIRIVPKLLRDVSNYSLEVKTLGQKMSLPIGCSPVAFQTLAHPLGEIATVRAISNVSTVMILSSYAGTLLEEVANEARGGSVHLWMQTYIFKNRTITRDIVTRAERAGFEAIVVTIDSPTSGVLTCNARDGIGDVKITNIPSRIYADDLLDKSITFSDLSWLRGITHLPIIAKGILSAMDAKRALSVGVKGILVSNHGGRQLDGDPATIDVLSDIVDEVKRITPRIDVYVDGGIRNGWDVYKAIAMGAKMVFVGRPVVFGLAKAGDEGVTEILNILRREFEEAMILSGASNPSKISRTTLKLPTCSVT